MKLPSKISLFVAAIAISALASSCVAWWHRSPMPGVWELSSFALVAFLLNQSNTQLRVAAIGSTSFVVHIAGGILFGGFWGGLIAGTSTLASSLALGHPPIKLLFNVSQRTLSVVLATTIYSILGGHLPPAYLQMAGALDRNAVQLDLALFFILSASYLIVNSFSVSGAVALTTGRRFKDVWNLNTRGVLGYDVGASSIAILVAWLYSRVEHIYGYGSLGLLGVVLPIIVVRHIYALYYQLQDSGQELLEVMVKAIEARDPYTSGHSLRVRELSRTIAVELNLSSAELEQVETAALLHDVGKIHEEFAPLLRKESRLTPEETALMQTHAAKSAELVGIISKFRGVIQDSVRHHHERWDGQGYPDGIAGSSIPLCSRIILVSDTIDAMTTDRPYRKRMTLDTVVTELTRCKGTQFDPAIVDVANSSVAVRRLILEGSSSDSDTSYQAVPRSKRVNWPKNVWRIGQA